MKKLFLSAAVLVAISGNVFAYNKVEAKKLFTEPFEQSKAEKLAVDAGETLGCSERSADGKTYTLLFNSTGKKNVVLTGKSASNTEDMFKAVQSKPAGDSVEHSFESDQSGASTKMKADVYATSDANKVCAVMWVAK